MRFPFDSAMFAAVSAGADALKAANEVASKAYETGSVPPSNEPAARTAYTLAIQAAAAAFSGGFLESSLMPAAQYQRDIVGGIRLCQGRAHSTSRFVTGG